MGESEGGRLHQLRVFLSLLRVSVLIAPWVGAGWLWERPYRRLVPLLFVELVALGGVGVHAGVIP